ncbi:hypothetical protein BH11PSE12_BH11PSE12_17290 [soil metagenome]
MTRNEKRILRNAIKSVTHHNRIAWTELKLQIYHNGYQFDYPVRGDFDFPAEMAIMRMSAEDKQLLLNEWKNTNSEESGEKPDSEIFNYYARVIVEEVVVRARAAAYRTVNW